jgi:predicted transposase/invertase (TIGR01784 family)
MVIGIRPINDFAFKKAFGSPENKVALIGLLNAILNRPVPIRDVLLENPFNPQDFLDDKLSVLDVKATDENGVIYDIEIQLSVRPGLIERLVFYGCEIYADQLRTGQDYTRLKPVVIIALVEETIWPEVTQLHHQFLFTDQESGRTLSDTLSVHTLELGKYNLTEQALATAGQLDRWLYWLLHAEDYEAQRLMELFPEEEIRRASQTLISISEITEDKTMYDAREKAIRDQQWAINVARNEGLIEGEAKGKIEGKIEGEIKGEIKGKIETIRILQGILLIPVSSEAELNRKSLADLQRMTAELQAMIQSRKPNS